MGEAERALTAVQETIGRLLREVGDKTRERCWYRDPTKAIAVSST